MEIIDYVNENDEVIGQIPLNEHDKLHVIHRSVHVFLFNSKNELLLARRAPTMHINPNKLSVFGGFVSAGETYEHAAKRELKEESGISVPLKKVTKTYHEEPIDRTFIEVFEGEYNRDIKDIKQNWESTKLLHKPLKEVVDEVFKTNPDVYSLAFKPALKAYCKAKGIRTF